MDIGTKFQSLGLRSQDRIGAEPSHLRAPATCLGSGKTGWVCPAVTAQALEQLGERC
jgi:hypothetical protein